MGITMNMGYALKGWEDKWMQSIEDYSKPIFDEFQNIIGYELTEVEQIAKRHFDYLAFSLGYYYKFHIIPNRLAISPTAGWYFDMLLNDNGELVDGGVNYRQGMRMLDTGPQLGAFIDVGRTFQIGVDYKIGVTDIMQKEYRLPELPVSSEKNRVFSIYIRILFS